MERSVSATWIGLGHTAFGAAVALLSAWLTNVWARSNQDRQQRTIRAEEIAEIAQQLHDWQHECFSGAFNGDVKPIPSILFRLSLLVGGYFPSVENVASQMSRAVG